MSKPRSGNRMLFRCEVWICLAYARFLIRFVQFDVWRGLLGPIDGEANGSETATDIAPLPTSRLKQAEDIGRIIERMARKTWFEAVCLPKAMAGRWILARRGIASRIVIGAGRSGRVDDLKFHAWLMVDGHCITGAAERAEFQAFRRKAGA